MGLATYEREGKYGVQTTFYFGFPTTGTPDGFYTGAAPVAGDVKISKDGGAPANVTNLPASVGNGIWSIVVTATEMQASDIAISIDDADGPAFGAVFLHIQTKLRLGQIDADATQIGGNTSAIKATGVGSGDGFNGTAGGTGKICNFFDTLEGSEVTSLPDNASFREILCWLKARFAFKREATSASLIVKRRDSATTLTTQTRSNDGTTMTENKVS